MIKCINAWAFEDSRSAPDMFKMAKQSGFEGVEVILGEGVPPGGHSLTPESTEADCRRMLEMADAAGIKIVSVASGLGWGYPITAEDSQTRKRGVELIAHGLRLAQWLKVDALLVVPGGVGAEFIPGFAITPYETAYRNAEAGLRELLPLARETGVTLGIENVWNKFLLSPLEMRAFIDGLGAGAGCYFDIGNVILTGYPEQWVEILGSRIKRVHAKDFKRDVGNISGFCDLLEGDVDYPTVMKELRKIGYDGPITAEFFNAEADLPKISSALDKVVAM